MSNGNATHLNHLAPPHVAISLANRAGVGRGEADKNVGRPENAYSNVWIAVGSGAARSLLGGGIAGESGYPTAWRDSWKPRRRMKVIGGDTGDALRSRVCAEFIEMPGLQLTFEQATRLWGIEPIVCRQVIDELVACGFLRRTASGRVMRADRH